MDEILEITVFLANTLEQLGTPYVVGGPLASSLHGIPRATQDVGIVADIAEQHVAALIERLRGRFYFDEEAIRDAVARRTSFNVIHLGTYFKADVFVAKGDEASRLQLERRQRYRLADPPGAALDVASPEDVVAQKLYWFRLGEGVSERQWNDAVGVLKVAGDRLDLAYLHRAAVLLGVDDLLVRAREEIS